MYIQHVIKMTIRNAIRLHKFLEDNPKFLSTKISYSLKKTKYEEEDNYFFDRKYTGFILKEEVSELLTRHDNYSVSRSSITDAENSEILRVKKHSNYGDLIESINVESTIETFLNNLSRWEKKRSVKSIKATESSVLLWPDEEHWPVSYDSYPITLSVDSVEDKRRKFLFFKRKPFRSTDVFRFVRACIKDQMFDLPKIT